MPDNVNVFDDAIDAAERFVEVDDGRPLLVASELDRRIEEIEVAAEEGEGTRYLEIGAGMTLTQVSEHEGVREHFPSLLAIAVPGPFFFMGDVPAELRQAAESMNMGAVFGSHVFGFSRS